tara:strand:- start:2867 stop:3805 length:939 start_codon:yes stop_codon:yes gene_type:complete
MIKEIPKSDVIVRPFKVYKEWTLDETDITPLYGTLQTDLYDSDTDDTNSNGISKRTLYDSVYAQFYLNPATASVLTEVGNRQSYASTNERIMGDTIGVIPIPHEYYGEGIKIGTLELQYGAVSVSDDGNSNLVDNSGNIKGNVFYDRGLIVVTKDVVDVTTLSNYQISYRSTMTIYENEIFLSVNENEFNVSQNPTAVFEDGGSKIEIVTNRKDKLLAANQFTTSSYYKSGIKSIRNSQYPYVSNFDGVSVGSFDDYITSGSVDQTGSYLAPYITTIGLYDEALNMVAVAKLPKPIKSLPDYPVNFIVRFDT